MQLSFAPVTIQIMNRRRNADYLTGLGPNPEQAPTD
jgi:hypothetical protein